MKGETRRYESKNGTIVAAKREMLDKTYIVSVYPENRGQRVVIVYADEMTGEDHGWPNDDNFGTMNADYDKVVYRKFPADADKSVEVAKIINEAVRKLEATIESDNSTEDAVLGALEANAEVHEDNI